MIEAGCLGGKSTSAEEQGSLDQAEVQEPWMQSNGLKSISIINETSFEPKKLLEVAYRRLES